MNELVNLIVKKTGIPAATATTIVSLVIEFLGKKLPGPIGNEVTALLNNDTIVSEAENLLGGLASSLEKSAATKKKK